MKDRALLEIATVWSFDMATFIAVHGGWHGGWCWQRVTPLLERQGHRVPAPDLPAHGDDHNSVTARPWEHYAATIAGLIERQPASVILVGHSSGGMVISAAARLVPDRIAALVYLAAFLLPPGATPRALSPRTPVRSSWMRWHSIRKRERCRFAQRRSGRCSSTTAPRPMPNGRYPGCVQNRSFPRTRLPPPHRFSATRAQFPGSTSKPRWIAPCQSRCSVR
ncbi:MAG: alpha/beta fold hydrolase [Thermomicrobiales bacterium]